MILFLHLFPTERALQKKREKRRMAACFGMAMTLVLLLALVVGPLSVSSSRPAGEELLEGGRVAVKADDMTPLQKHVSFFDRNKDGAIYPWETYQGFRAIGCNVAVSASSSALIHAALAPKTKKGAITSPLLPIYVVNIHKGKHGSDSGCYDEQGNFVPEKFQEIFTKHAKTKPDALTKEELDAMLQANKAPGDLAGSAGSAAEWKLFFDLGKNKDDGTLHKDTIRSVFDGTFFYELEKTTKAA